MPLYEYVCKACEHPFEELVFGSETPNCPSCGSGRLERQISTFGVSEGGPDPAPPPGGPCAGCPADAGGAGSCPMGPMG